MADGDEKIDHNDRVLILNRMTADCICLPPARACRCGKTEGIHNGITLVWEPGQVRSIARDFAEHYCAQSRVIACPMNSYYPVRRLVVVDENRQPIEDGASADPLTEAQCRELRKRGAIDPTNMPEDRILMGGQLKDPTTGEYPRNVESKPAPQGGGFVPSVTPRSGADRAATDAALDHV